MRLSNFGQTLFSFKFNQKKIWNVFFQVTIINLQYLQLSLITE